MTYLIGFMFPGLIHKITASQGYWSVLFTNNDAANNVYKDDCCVVHCSIKKNLYIVLYFQFSNKSNKEQ